MYQIFIVGAKLLGIHLIITALIEGFILVNAVNASFAPGFGLRPGAIAIACLLTLSAGTALAFFTGTVAKVLRVEEHTSEPLPVLSLQPALEIGIVLLGLLQFLVFLPQTVRHALDYSQQFTLTRNPADLLSGEAVGCLAALVLVCFARRIAGLIARVNRPSPGP